MLNMSGPTEPETWTIGAKSAVQNQCGLIIHLLLVLVVLHSQQNQAEVISSPYRWRLHSLSSGPKVAAVLLWRFSLAMSGHQTQTRDFCREEGVQDEDNGLWTRVEVQLLEETKETICNLDQAMHNVSKM